MLTFTKNQPDLFQQSGQRLLKLQRAKANLQSIRLQIYRGCQITYNFIIIIIFFLHGLGRLTCSGIDAFPSFPVASTISSSSMFVVEGVFRESGFVQSFNIVDPVLLVFGSHVFYSRDL